MTMMSSTRINSHLDYRAIVAESWSKSDGTFNVETNPNSFSGRRFLRGLQTETNTKTSTSCLNQGDKLDARCKRALLVQPILFGVFVVIFIFICIFCCSKKHKNDIPDSLTQDEQEQRENQQRQLRMMAAQRRRERELHRIQLENNARLEKIKKRVVEEENVRRALLLSTFKREGLEKTLTEDDFVSDMNESDTVLTSDEIESKNNATYEGNASIDSKKTWDQQEQPMSHLRVKLDRSDGKSPQAQHLTSKSPLSTFPNECAICLQEYQPTEVIVASNNPSCVHCYHRDCVLEYLIPLLDVEGNHNESTSDEGNADNDRQSPSSPSTTHSHDGKSLPCPCCRRPFLVNPPRIDEEVSLSTLHDLLHS